MSWLLLIGGLVLLTGGAEALVRGASRLALAMGISPLVVGLTVVAYGTSAPEMAVSVTSSLAGNADVAVGNVVGSNVFNVLVILGLSALIVPLVVDRQLVRFDVPLMIGVSVVVLLMALDGALGRLEGGLLLGGALVYTAFSIRQSRRETRAAREEYQQFEQQVVAPGRSRWPLDLGLILGGLALLVVGGKLLVDGAVEIARVLGVSELVIGLTIVAAGTSMPEVATSLVAALRGERDIAVGNVVGSNLFNLLVVLGLAGAVAPAGVAVAPSVLRFDLVVMVAVAFACLPVFFTGHLIARWEGALFLGYYVAYVSYLVLAALGHQAMTWLGAAMVWFVIPLTLVTLAVGTVRAVRERRSGRAVRQ